MAEQELLVRIVGDDRALQAAFTRSTRASQKFSAEMEATNLRTARVGQAARGALSTTGGAGGFLFGSGAFIAAALTTAAIAKSIGAASDLNEEITKSQQVFGDASRSVQDFADTTASALGVAKVQALQATGIFGNLFSTVGLDQTQAAGMSQSLVQLAADLASFNNADISDVLAAIRSGLIGEAEPLRRYGVLLSETRVQQDAMAATGKTNVKSLTDQEKALARYNIILQDTVPAQGDFARTSDGLANQTRILQAQLSDLSAELGTKLLPHLLTAAQAANSLLDGFNALSEGAEFKIDIDNIDLQTIRDTRTEIAGLTGDTNLLVVALDRAIELLNSVQLSPDNAAGPRGPGAISASNERVEEQNRQDAARAAQRRLEASRKRFAEFTKGLDLKLKRAGLTEGLNDDIAVLEEIERAIRRQIRQEGHTFALENDLADVQLQIARTRESQQAQIDAEESAAASRARTRRENRRRRAQERREDARDAREAEQFAALGLTAAGDQRVPGIGALRRRARSLLEQISGTDLDTSRNRNRIGAVLSKQFNDAGREVRDAILSMFNDISSALGDGSKSLDDAMKTSFRVVNTSNILSGIGLSEEDEKRLRSRLSRLGPGGTTPRDGGAGGAFGLNVGGGGNVVVTGNVTVVADDPEKFGRELEKKTRRSALNRTGHQAGRRK